jgi:arabinofuranosyltransferase
VECAVALTLVLLLAHAAVYWFLTDDAFISFRYARNLSRGYGLVFNPGFERVEGYSNFLWVVLLAACYGVGLSAETVANVLSLAATVALWGLVVWFVYRRPLAPGRRWLLLVAPLFLAATRSVAVWSTGGLETRLFEVLVLGGALRLVVEVEGRLAERPRQSVAAVLFALATLARPDGLLISLAALATGAGQLALRRRLALRPFAMQIGSYALIVGAHYAFRRAYYGQWLPNTYYAKVGGRTWWDMGFVYLGLFALEYAAYLWIPLLIGAVREHLSRRTLFTPALFAAIVVPHALYIAAIGGDHFEFRPLDLYFPFVFILLYDGARRLPRRRIASVLTAGYLGLVLLGVTWLPYQSHIQFPNHYLTGFPGMAQDWVASTNFMRPERDAVSGLPGLRSVARAYGKLLRNATARYVGIRQEEHRLFLASVLPDGPRLRRLVDAGWLPPDFHLALDCVGAIPYYSDLRVLDLLGLTDAHVAHAGVHAAGRLMAHDQLATDDYVRQAGVDLAPLGGVHCALHVSDPSWLPIIGKRLRSPAPLYVADIDDGYRLCGFLPQGIDHAARRMPRLVYRPLADSDVAMTILEQVVAAQRRKLLDQPADVRARIVLADALALWPGHEAEALARLQALTLERPEDAILWDKLAWAYFRSRDFEAALAAAERALKLAWDQGDQARVKAWSGRLADWRARLWSTPEEPPDLP